MFLLIVGQDAVRQLLDELTRQRCLADRMQLALDLDLCGRVGGEDQIGAVLFNAELEVRQDFQHAFSSVSTTPRLMSVAASSSRILMLFPSASSCGFSRSRVDSSLPRRIT